MTTTQQPTVFTIDVDLLTEIPHSNEIPASSMLHADDDLHGLLYAQAVWLTEYALNKHGYNGKRVDTRWGTLFAISEKLARELKHDLMDIQDNHIVIEEPHLLDWITTQLADTVDPLTKTLTIIAYKSYTGHDVALIALRLGRSRGKDDDLYQMAALKAIEAAFRDPTQPFEADEYGTILNALTEYHYQQEPGTKRTEHLKIRLTPIEAEYLKARAGSMTLSDYARERLLDE